MKKIIAIILIFTNFSMFSEVNDPIPYKYDEFHPILHDIRRSSIIFCGAFPLGYMYTSVVLDPILSNSNIYQDLDDVEKNNKEIEVKLFSSLIFAGLIMIIDLVIEKFFKR